MANHDKMTLLCDDGHVMDAIKKEKDIISEGLIHLIGGMLIAAGFALDYLSGRADEREHYRLEEKPAIPMEHVHGGDPDDL